MAVHVRSGAVIGCIGGGGWGQHGHPAGMNCDMRQVRHPRRWRCIHWWKAGGCGDVAMLRAAVVLGRGGSVTGAYSGRVCGVGGGGTQRRCTLCRKRAEWAHVRCLGDLGAPPSGWWRASHPRKKRVLMLASPLAPASFRRPLRASTGSAEGGAPGPKRAPLGQRAGSFPSGATGRVPLAGPVACPTRRSQAFARPAPRHLEERGEAAPPPAHFSTEGLGRKLAVGWPPDAWR